MKNEDYRKVKNIFQSAIEIVPKERAAFLDKECGEDKELRSAVELLLDAEDREFMEEPAIAQMADAIVEDENEREPTKDFPDAKSIDQLGRYKIVSKIGKGGSGEVFLAKDTTLDRKVAIKFLNKQFSHDTDKLNRFIQEAKAASALNNPNILTVYEIGAFENRNFIVTEFIEGKDLNQYLAEEEVSLENVLDISIQIVSALQTAHESGIIHRDIKPANIKVRKDGLVKVLDFGLAKLTEKPNPEGVDSETVTIAKISTVSGMILGTPNYMSPEQARGKQTDARTDIFSFGIVLYEMLSGHNPFSGETITDTIIAIAEKNLPPISGYVRDLPHELEEIVNRILTKELDGRYQTAKELQEDLEKIKIQIDFEKELKRLSPRERVSRKEQGEAATLAQKQNPTLMKRVETSEGNEKKKTDRWFSFPKINWQKVIAALSFLAVSFVIIVGLTWFFNERSDKLVAPKLYRQMEERETLDFIQQRARHVQGLIGDEPKDLDENIVQAIRAKIDRYVKRTDSLSQEFAKDGLRSVYGRASQYVPLIVRAFKAQNVPPTLGIYLAMIESEYRDCIISPTGPIGMFQMQPSQAAKYGLELKENCDVEKQSDAAARYMSDLISDFGEEKASWTLALFSYNQGESKTRKQLRSLRRRGITERNVWVILRHQESVQPALLSEPPQYVHSFFAAAIIGETPQAFQLATPPLSTLTHSEK